MQLITQIPALEILNIYIASAGMVQLALERANRTYYPEYDPLSNPHTTHLTEVDLHQILSQPHVITQLQDAARAQIIMSTFQAANQAIAMMLVKLPGLDPFEASKTATNLITKLEELTDRKSNVEMNNTFIWEQVLAPEAQDAINYLKQNRPNSDSNIIDMQGSTVIDS